MPVEPPDPQTLTTFDYLVQIGGAISVAFMAWLGTRRKPEPPTTATVSAAMVDNRVVDPLVAAIQRLSDLMEQEVRLRQTSAEDTRKAEEAKRLAVVVADAVRDDILSEVRAEFHKNEPAEMPRVRGKP